MEMANYILSIFKTNLNIIWSWGFNSPKALPDNKGLAFKVQGFIHKGWVLVEYNEGSDLFDIKLLTNQLEEIKSLEGIYIEQLIDVIDDTVEFCDNYEQQIKDEYSLK